MFDYGINWHYEQRIVLTARRSTVLN